MKKNEKLLLYYLTVVLLLLGSASSYGQDRKEKTTAIINKFHFVKYQKRKYEIKFDSLKHKAQGNDSLKLVELENQLTEDELTKRICTAFYKVFSDDEIDDIYNFIQTSASKKLSNSGEIIKAVAIQFSDFDKQVATIINSSGE